MSKMQKVKMLVKQAPGVDYYLWVKSICDRRRAVGNMSTVAFYTQNFKRIKLVPSYKSKGKQFERLASTIRIKPVNNESFFYSIDEFVTPKLKDRILDNMTVDYSIVINSFIDSYTVEDTGFKYDENQVIKGLKNYIFRALNDDSISSKYESQFKEIESIFYRPATSFHEALQRILFVNQWVWQTGHFDNGLGHLDWILEKLYLDEVEAGTSKQAIFVMIKDFFKVLHEYYWSKSANLPGDIGQIIVLGGMDSSGHYHCNDLTYMFLSCAKELSLPDPKVLLRVSHDMPDSLIDEAIACLSTGIGGPVFSNDDVLLPLLEDFGFDKEQASGYITSACWEPMVINGAIEQNNIGWINFAQPICKLIEENPDGIVSFEKLVEDYKFYLREQLEVTLSTLDNKSFERDPLVSLFYGHCLECETDISEGGGNRFNLGITGVGMSTAVNSLLNIKKLVYESGRYTVFEIFEACKHNFEDAEFIREDLENAPVRFGQDQEEVINLTNELTQFVSTLLKSHHTKYGGDYKFGLSSPRYIMESKSCGATPDGRRHGEPFDVHISGRKGISPVELMLFASKLEYSDNRFNANVVDFILPPSMFESPEKIRYLLRGGIDEGVFQMQINVISSKTLIDAQKYPERYSSLVVRVWGFSAYFVDLPKEYQDNLIRRTINSENATGFET